MVRVLATGTFELLHPGHLLYLEEAKNRRRAFCNRWKRCKREKAKKNADYIRGTAVEDGIGFKGGR
jgi:glycerol-3-phosphate cytidylyltransferase-like family protein